MGNHPLKAKCNLSYIRIIFYFINPYCLFVFTSSIQTNKQTILYLVKITYMITIVFLQDQLVTYRVHSLNRSNYTVYIYKTTKLDMIQFCKLHINH